MKTQAESKIVRQKCGKSIKPTEVDVQKQALNHDFKYFYLLHKFFTDQFRIL